MSSSGSSPAPSTSSALASRMRAASAFRCVTAQRFPALRYQAQRTDRRGCSAAIAFSRSTSRATISDERLGFRLLPGQQAHQADPGDAPQVVRLGIDEGRHDGNAERLHALHVLGVREVGHARDQHVRPRGHQRVERRRHVPAVADLLDLTRPGLAPQIVVVAVVAADGDDPVLGPEGAQHGLVGLIVDGDPLDRRADHRGARQVSRQGRRLLAPRNEHEAGALRRPARRAAPGDDGRLDVHDAVAVPFDDAEGLRIRRFERLAGGRSRIVGDAGPARGQADGHDDKPSAT